MTQVVWLGVGVALRFADGGPGDTMYNITMSLSVGVQDQVL